MAKWKKILGLTMGLAGVMGMASCATTGPNRNQTNRNQTYSVEMGDGYVCKVGSRLGEIDLYKDEKLIALSGYIWEGLGLKSCLLFDEDKDFQEMCDKLFVCEIMLEEIYNRDF